MASGNDIIVSSNPRGVFIEGIVNGTPKPGTVMQLDVSEAPVQGKFTWEPYNADADGNQRLIAVLRPDHLQGKKATEAYADGDVCFLYCPVMGEELNMLLKNVGGTGDSFSRGDRLIVDDGNGKLINTTGTPESEPFQILEDVPALTEDTLAHCMFTGY